MRLYTQEKPSQSLTYGRASTAHSRALEGQQTGLPQGMSHYDLLLLIKKAGRGLGFSPRMIVLLEYYMAFTKPCDWAKDAATGPVVYQSLARTALDLGVSERQIQRLEKQLHDVGALRWKDSGNHKRYGQRCKQSGALLYAYGADLAPLCGWVERLQDHLARKKRHDDAWLKAKREISFYRRACRAMLAELEQGHEQFAARYEVLAAPAIRSGMALQKLEALHSKHKTLHQELQALLSHTQSRPDDKRVAHNQYQTQDKSGKPESEKIDVIDPGKKTVPQSRPTELRTTHAAERAGLDQISLRDALAHLTPELLSLLMLQCRGQVRGWGDVIDTAHAHARALRVTQEDWARACALLTRAGAALCVIATARAMAREYQPVTRPAAYFRAMITRAETGRLDLAASVRGQGTEFQFTPC